MSWIATAVIGGTLIGGLIQGSAAQGAAQTQANAAENAQQISLQEFNTINQQEQPFIQSGTGALSALDYGLGIPGSYSPGGYYPSPGNTGVPPVGNRAPAAAGGGSSLRPVGDSGIVNTPRVTVGPSGPAPSGTSPSAAGTPPPGFGSLTTPFTTANWQQLSPAYNFQLEQGQQNVLNTDSPGQGSLSGAAAKDLINYNQGLAGTSFQNAFNMYQTQQGNIFSRLSGIANLGQSAASQTAQSGTALAGQAAQSATNVGTALAGGQVGAANAYSGALSSALPWLYAGGVGGGAAAGSDAAAAAYSDRRLKTDIKKVGELDSGLPVYRYRYKGDSLTRMGVMADEVQKVIPEAVVRQPNGYLSVFYNRLH